MSLLNRLALGLVVLALTACTDRSFTPTTPEALLVGTPQTIFAATTRNPGPDGTFGPERSDKYSLLELTVSIPPNHQPGELEFAYKNPNPQTQFTMAQRRVFDTPEAFQARLFEETRNLPASQRDVTIFVHGFNSTQATLSMVKVYIWGIKQNI